MFNICSFHKSRQHIYRNNEPKTLLTQNLHLSWQVTVDLVQDAIYQPQFQRHNLPCSRNTLTRQCAKLKLFIKG